MKKSNLLLALSSSALAIPCGIQAAEAPTSVELGYMISNYVEDPIEAKDNITGESQDRYDITVQQFNLLVPVGNDQSLNLSYIQDTMSGASPWDIVNVNGENKVIISGASIKESRKDLRIGYKFYDPDRVSGINLARSVENDYDSTAIGGNVEISANQKNTTIAMAASISLDNIYPTQGIYLNTLDGTIKDTKNTYSISTNITQIINRNHIFQAGLSINQHLGYLSDPYKLNDKRPDTRLQTAAIFRLRSFIKSWDAALHTGYRFYQDDWEVRSDTFDISLYKNLSNDIKIVPGIRYYTQDSAFFYRPNSANAGNQVFISTDYRLAYYGAVSVSFKVIKYFSDFSIFGTVERYESGANLALGKPSSENAANVNFSRISLGMTYKF